MRGKANKHLNGDSGGRGSSNITSREEVYTLIKAALAEIPRYDEPVSYGVADDVGTEWRIIFFDLPRVSPLQFNVPFQARGAHEQEVTRLIKEAVVARLDVS
jgi:hypothetical protein